MFKEALICGAGMVFDMSGSNYALSQNAVVALNDGIVLDWQNVGVFLQDAIVVEGPKIEADAAKQLQLSLT